MAPYCTQTVNRVIAFNTTTDITFKISTSPSYTGNVYIYYTPSAQTIYCDQGSAGLTLTLAGCTAATTGGIPAGSLPVGKYNGTYAVVANAFSDPSTSPVAPTVWSRTLSGTGVDCSDNEVNIKIALNAEMAAGRLKIEPRNTLLASMTDDVADLVLEDNRLQTLALSIAESGGAGDCQVRVSAMRNSESSLAEMVISPKILVSMVTPAAMRA